MKRRLIFLCLAALLLAALACSDGAYYGPPAGGTRTPRPTPTPTLEGLVGAFYAAELAGAEAERAQNLATVRAAEALATVRAAEADAQAAAALLAAQVEATARAIDARATVAALDAQATARALELELTATARADLATATADAGRLTATADAGRLTATAAAGQWTATAWAVEARATAWAGGVTATHTAAEAEREALALQRERITQPALTWGPWGLLVLAVIAAALITWRVAVVLELRGRAIKRDLRGDAPLLLLPGAGGLAVYDPDRALGPATVIDAQSVTAPTLADPERQERTTARDQAVDLKTRGLPAQAGGRRRVGGAMPGLLTPPQPGSGPATIRIVPPQRLAEWLEDVEGQLVEGEHEH